MDLMTEGDGLPILLGQICASLRIEKTNGERDGTGQKDYCRGVSSGLVHGFRGWANGVVADLPSFLAPSILKSAATPTRNTS
jgi:hypothetical protein